MIFHILAVTAVSENFPAACKPNNLVLVVFKLDEDFKFSTANKINAGNGAVLINYFLIGFDFDDTLLMGQQILPFLLNILIDQATFVATIGTDGFHKSTLYDDRAKFKYSQHHF